MQDGPFGLPAPFQTSNRISDSYPLARIDPKHFAQLEIAALSHASFADLVQTTNAVQTLPLPKLTTRSPLRKLTSIFVAQGRGLWALSAPDLKIQPTPTHC